MFKTGSDTLSVALKLCRLLYPSSSSRRNTRSSTRVWDIPNSSNVCGTAGANPVRIGTSRAAMNEKILAHLIGRFGSIVYTRSGASLRQTSCEGLPPAGLWDFLALHGLGCHPGTAL